nr:MAG TPA: hypothetical protein [Caudoviricetes sp.]
MMMIFNIYRSIGLFSTFWRGRSLRIFGDV